MALKRFYGTLFGWRVHLPEESSRTCVLEATENGAGVGVDPAWDDGSGPPRLRVEVRDLREDLSLAEELGGTVVAPPRDLPGLDTRYALIADPAERVVVLSQSRARGV